MSTHIIYIDIYIRLCVIRGGIFILKYKMPTVSNSMASHLAQLGTNNSTISSLIVTQSRCFTQSIITLSICSTLVHGTTHLLQTCAHTVNGVEEGSGKIQQQRTYNIH